MSTAALLGLETSQSYKALNNITKSLDQLFKVRVQDQKSEEVFYKESVKIKKREKADQERYADTNIQTAKDYEKAIKNAGSEEGKNNAMLMGGALLAAALLGTTGALKGAGNLFGRSSTFVKEFTESFEKETEKQEKKNNNSSPSSTPAPAAAPQSSPQSRQPAQTPSGQGQVVTKGSGKAFEHYKYLTQTLKLSDIHARGLVANAMRESSLKPGARGDNGNSWGLLQWNVVGGRRNGMVRAVPDWETNWKGQYKYALTEDVGPQYAPKNFKSANQAANWWAKYWERPRDSHDHQKFIDAMGFQKGGQAKRKDNGPKTEDRLAMSLRLNPDLSNIPIQKKQKGGKIFLHWTASGHDANFPQNYHTVFDGAGTAKRNQTYSKFRTPKGHTWGRNGQGVALSLASMAGPNHDPWRVDPPTDKQIHGMAREIALIAKKWKWSEQDINSANVMTHAEAARIDGYGPGSGDPETRWDLLQLKKGESDWSGGHKLRALAKNYFKGTQGTIPEIENTQGPQPSGPAGGPEVLNERDDELLNEQDKDERTRRETTTIERSSIAEEFLQYGEMGAGLLQMFRDIQAKAGFNIFGDLSDKVTTEVDYLDTAQGNQADRIIPPQQPQEDTGIVGEEPQQQEKAEKQQEEKAKNVQSIIKNLKKANHPDTGPGFQIAGMLDYKKRPVVLSQAAAYNLAKAIEGGATFKGKDVSSSQRSRAKNASLRGAHPNSVHLYGEGLDLVGDSMRSLKIHGPKFGWKFGYNHNEDGSSAHFDYKGPRKLQAGGVVSMQSGGSLASDFNSQHGSSMMQNKYSRPVVIVKRRPSVQLPSDIGGSAVDDGFTGNRMSNQNVSTSMYKIQMGALV